MHCLTAQGEKVSKELQNEQYLLKFNSKDIRTTSIEFIQVPLQLNLNRYLLVVSSCLFIIDCNIYSGETFILTLCT